MASVRPKETSAKRKEEEREGKKEEVKSTEPSPQKRKAEDESTMEVTEVGHDIVRSRTGHIFSDTYILPNKKKNKKFRSI